MYDCVMIGTTAAKLRGILPTWREGVTNDIDLICTSEAAQKIAADLNLPLVEHVPGRAILRSGDSKVELEIATNIPTQWAGNLEQVDINIGTIQCRIGAPELIWMLRSYSVGLALSSTLFEKALRDAVFYDSLGMTAPESLLRYIEDRRQWVHAVLLETLNLDTNEI